jgi:phosphatidylserine/phosphatidylglycerophosphate/cardiolipin synthase-like enzyme
MPFRRRFVPISLPIFLTLAHGLIGCGADSADAPHADVEVDTAEWPDGKADGAAPVIPADARAVLEIYPLDIWAQSLPAKEMTLEVTGQSGQVTSTGSPVRYVPLSAADTIQLRLSATHHVPMEVSVRYDGSNGAGAWTVTSDAHAQRQGLGASFQPLKYGDRVLPTQSLYLGLRHKWFSSQGRPARRGNQIQLLMDGEETWSNVRLDLAYATDSILVSTWWWESDFELVRNPETHHLLGPRARWGNTILGILEKSPAYKRVLVGQFWGQDSVAKWLTADADLRGYAEGANDRFEFMGMANGTRGKFFFEPATFSFAERVKEQNAKVASRTLEQDEAIPSNVPARAIDMTEWPVGFDTQHASYHQKFLVIDDAVAYVGGMNFRRVDWDTNEHHVFDHRRMLFKATQAERQAVRDKNKLPDAGPRKDYMIRVQGPAAQDVADVFKLRWDHQIDRGVEYANRSARFEVGRDIPAMPGGPQVQITTTLPQPFWEHAIAETWINAIGEAQRYVFIEDQYFRMPMLNDLIADRMEKVPGLRLVVITKPVNDWTDPGCEWTSKSHELFKARFPSRYMMLRLRSFDSVVTWGWDETESRFANIDVHSKMLIVDDAFMSVGSCNKNNRGLVYEGEMNVAVADEDFVSESFQRILANILPPGEMPSDDVAGWWAQLAAAAKHNDAVYARWEDEGFDIDLNGAPLPSTYKPKGFLYSLDFLPYQECFLEGVGPDMVTQED